MNNPKKNSSEQKFYPPVVSVLGHVDHGKTTLLDVIRKSNIAAREHGGITQKIGASTVEVLHEGIKRKITFIDTPGHEAFFKMRSRGSQVADIGLLVVSAVDGVMPQTKESIELLKKDNTAYIVVLTKIDSPEKNPEKVKQQLSREHVLLEGYGGNVPVIEVSARTGQNIKELLDLILLVSDFRSSDKSLSETSSLKAIVIESKLDPKAGSRATVVIKNGTITVKDEIVAEGVEGKVRSLNTDTGVSVQKATIGEAVEILGFQKVPTVGSIVLNKKQSILETEVQPGTTSPASDKRSSEAINTSNDNPEKTLNLILVGDTQGSLEAIVHSLPKEVDLITHKTGEVSEADILFAKSTGAIVLTFNIKLRPDILKFATTEKVLLKNYTIIYEMLDEIRQVIEGKQIAAMEQIFGVAKILATFPFEKTKVLGVKILDGRIARGDKMRLVRGEEVIGESMIVSLRQGKNQVSKMEKNNEAGIIISPLLDFTIGDMIVCHS